MGHLKIITPNKNLIAYGMPFVFTGKLGVIQYRRKITALRTNLQFITGVALKNCSESSLQNR